MGWVALTVSRSLILFVFKFSSNDVFCRFCLLKLDSICGFIFESDLYLTKSAVPGCVTELWGNIGGGWYCWSEVEDMTWINVLTISSCSSSGVGNGWIVCWWGLDCVGATPKLEWEVLGILSDWLKVVDDFMKEDEYGFWSIDWERI